MFLVYPSVSNVHNALGGPWCPYWNLLSLVDLTVPGRSWCPGESSCPQWIPLSLQEPSVPGRSHSPKWFLGFLSTGGSGRPWCSWRILMSLKDPSVHGILCCLWWILESLVELCVPGVSECSFWFHGVLGDLFQSRCSWLILLSL